MSVITEAVIEHKPSAVFAMFSGGHDSLASTILAAEEPSFDGVLHINTGIGIEATREFVRETCKERGWPLTELFSEASYEELVLGRGGFPYGPAAHSSFYWHLKRKPLEDWLRQQDGIVGLVTGIRRSESSRRASSGISTPVRLDRRKLWISPILNWTALDCSDLIAREGFRRNDVVALLHRSGECLCGALARSGEIHDVDAWYPEVGARIHALERACETVDRLFIVLLYAHAREETPRGILHADLTRPTQFHRDCRWRAEMAKGVA